MQIDQAQKNSVRDNPGQVKLKTDYNFGQTQAWLDSVSQES